MNCYILGLLLSGLAESDASLAQLFPYYYKETESAYEEEKIRCDQESIDFFACSSDPLLRHDPDQLLYQLQKE